MSLDLSCVKVTSTVAGQVLLKLSDDVFRRVHRLDEIGPGALRHLDGDRRFAVHPGDGRRVLEGRAHFRHVAERHRRVAGDGDGEAEDVTGLLDERRHLHREAPGGAFQRARCDQAVGRVERCGEFVERKAVALQQHRLGDHLDHFVAGAAEIGGEHAGDLLDHVLRLPGELQQRAFRHVAAERHDEHREQRKVHLLDLRLVGVARQFALGVVDLRPHIGQRHVGIESRLELQEHVAAALEGRGAHFLDVLDRFQLRLERPQDQPFRILRADAALGDVDVDDRDGDVRLRLLGNGEVCRKAGHEQEQQRGDRQPRVVDRVIDRIEHGPPLRS
jgi:hypothetical protein